MVLNAGMRSSVRWPASSLMPPSNFAEQEAFVGHIGGDDFVFICDDDKADAISQKIIDAFDKLSPSFYNDEDRAAGFITGVDRQGNTIKAGLVSVSIGIVSNVNQKITHVAQIGELGAELKKFAKSVDKSNFQRDQEKVNRNKLSAAINRKCRAYRERNCPHVCRVRTTPAIGPANPPAIVSSVTIWQRSTIRRCKTGILRRTTRRLAATPTRHTRISLPKCTKITGTIH